MTTYSSNTYLSEYGTEMTANANYIYSFFRSKGWTKQSISAMLGNMQRESTINPGLWYSLKEGDTSVALGLVQWYPASKLINWCNSKGYDYLSIEAQCNKIMDELNNGGQWIATSDYPESFSEFTKSTKDIEYLTYVFLKNYERADVDAVSERIKHANYWFNHLSGSSTTYQYFMFPMNEYIYISQGENGSYSHKGTLCIDFLGWNENGRVYKCPYYAPCDCKCVAKGSGGDWVAFESLDKVLCADGTLSKMCWVQVHDDTPLSVGTTVKQGEVIGHTGTTGNVTGDHLHLNVAKGEWANSGWVSSTSTTDSHIKNEVHIFDVMYVRAYSKMLSDITYNIIEVPDTPGGSGGAIKHKKHNFKFFIFNRRIRNG